MEILDEVIRFATEAHGSQVRKYSGEKYITHPIQVMEICNEYTDDICVLSAAILHDVLEDTNVGEEQIRQFLDDIMRPHDTFKTLKLVVELTDVYTKRNYPTLNRSRRREKEIQRLASVSPEAQSIKYADVIHNAINISEHDPDFAIVYLHEGQALLQKMNKGDNRLYVRAVSVLENCVKKLKVAESKNKRPVIN